MQPSDFDATASEAMSDKAPSPANGAGPYPTGTQVTNYIGPAAFAPTTVKPAAPFALPETKAEPPSVYGSGPLIQPPPGPASSAPADMPFEPFFAIGGSFSALALLMSLFTVWNAVTSSHVSSRGGVTWFTLALAAIGLVICSLSFLTAEAGDGAARSEPVRRLRRIAIVADMIIIILAALQIIFSWLP